MQWTEGQSLEGGLKLQEFLGPHRGWRASQADTSFRVYPKVATPVASGPPVAGELPAIAEGDGWVAYPYRLKSLAEYWEKAESFSLEEALDLGTQVLDVLAAQAAAGRLHRGLHPHLCFFADSGRLEVAGYEADLGDEAYRNLRPAEQKTRSDGGGASVTYAGGALLFRLLTGTYPQEAKGQSPSQLCPSIPAWIDRVIGLSLEKDPNHRYDSLKTFRAALGAVRSAIRLRASQGNDSSESSQVSTTRPPPMRQGPMGPLGRRRPGGLRPLPIPAVQDKAGMGQHPEAIGEILPKEPTRAEPEYRFSWRKTLTVGLPSMLVLGFLATWMVLWVLSLWNS